MRVVWMLSKFYIDAEGRERPVCMSYAESYIVPRHPGSAGNGWALVRCQSSAHQIMAAMQDSRVKPLVNMWDIISEEAVEAYAPFGAKSGMCLGQLLACMAKVEAPFMALTE